MPQFEGLGAILRRVMGKSNPDYVPIEEPTDQDCDKCGGSGWVTVHVPLGHLLFGQAQACSCQPAIYLQTFENFKVSPEWPDLAEARDIITVWTEGEGPPIAVLNADRGRGKSHLSKAAVNAVRKRGHEIEWNTHGGILDRLHSSFGDSGTGSLMASIEAARWMVIDDLGQANASETMEGLVDRIIDKRSEAAERGCRTLFTTNLTPSDFSPRTESRLRDVRLVKSFTIHAPDFRLNPIEDAEDYREKRGS